MIDLTYQHVLHQVANRMNALVGSTVAQITITYDKVTLTAADFKSADWPFNSFRDTIIMAVADFSLAIADTKGHVWRRYLLNGLSVTGDLANKAFIPTVDAANREIIGVPDVVFDSVDLTHLEEVPLDVVRRLNRETWRDESLYYYHIGDSLSIEHTRPNVKIVVCTYSRSDQLAAWPNGNIALPSVLEPGIVSRTISLMTKDGAFEDQAAVYRTYSDQQLALIRMGQDTAPNIKLP